MAIDVKAFVFHPKRDAVLALRRRKNQRWTFPGGRFNASLDQLLLNAFDRELPEEGSIQRDPAIPLDLLALHLFRPYDGCTIVARAIGRTRAASDKVKLDNNHDAHIWIPTVDLGALALESTLADTLPLIIDENGAFKFSSVEPSKLLLPLNLN